MSVWIELAPNSQALSHEIRSGYGHAMLSYDITIWNDISKNDRTSKCSRASGARDV